MFYRILVISIILPIFIGIRPPAPKAFAATATWYTLADWSYRKSISIDRSQIPANQSNFSLLISISNDNDLKNNVSQANAEDILFTSGDGKNKLAHEIASWNAGTGSLEAWVNVPLINSIGEATNTTIYIYYGQANCVNQETADSSVWDADYVVVQHLDESPADDVAGHLDSTANGNNGTPRNFAAGGGSTNAVGRVAGADLLDGLNDYVKFPEPPAASTNINTGSVFAWIKTADAGGGWRGIVSKQVAYGMYLNNNQFSIYDWTAGQERATGVNVADDAWHHVGFTFQSGVVNGTKLYIDGQERLLTTLTIAAHTEGLVFGAGSNPGGSQFFTGTIDEATVSNTVRSLEWIQSTFANQKPLATLLSVNVQEAEANQSNWYDSPVWIYRKKITINAAQVPNTDQTDFPVLINSTDLDWRDTVNTGHVGQSNGNDILFTASDGTSKLNHEIEHYDDSTGELVSWVKVPSISASTNTDIFIYYGNAAVANQQDISNVWNNDFELVQHLNETPANDVTGHLDSTANGFDGAPKNFNSIATSSTDAAGKIAGADRFDGSNDYVEFGNILAFDRNVPFTYSAWFRSNSGVGGAILSKMAAGAPYRGYDIYYRGDGQIRAHIISTWSANAIAKDTTTAACSDNNWHYIVVTYDGSSILGGLNIFVDGDPQATATGAAGPVTATIVETTSFRIGTRTDAQRFNGFVDEVRFLNANLTADWIKTEHNNQNSPGTFYAIGPEECNLKGSTIKGG
ncbi:DUF2341 domain-containing protein [Planctomycetota bacterium]